MQNKKILINYANNAFKESQKLNSKTGMKIGNFDRVIEYSPKDIDKKFYEKNKHILTQLRGGGYWLWKPYIILKTLMRKDIKHGDYIFYADSGSYSIDKVDCLIDLSKKYKQDVIPFSNKDADTEKVRTKRDAFILMGLDSKKYTDTPQRGTGFILLKKSKTAIEFSKEFLKYAQDKRIITDIPSKLKEDYSGFMESRHDQSIFSLLTKKYNFKPFRQPWQVGNKEKHLWEDNYPQIIVSTRKSSRNLLEKIKYQKACSKNLYDFIKKLSKIPLNYILNKTK
jgi:hypothetical protein